MKKLFYSNVFYLYEQLFDYDVEVQPILEMLVGKTIEQALIEVFEEEEIAKLREQQRKFLELRLTEKAEQQRLEEQERRLREEKVIPSLKKCMHSISALMNTLTETLVI